MLISVRASLMPAVTAAQGKWRGPSPSIPIHSFHTLPPLCVSPTLDLSFYTADIYPDQFFFCCFFLSLFTLQRTSILGLRWLSLPRPKSPGKEECEGSDGSYTQANLEPCAVLAHHHTQLLQVSVERRVH